MVSFFCAENNYTISVIQYREIQKEEGGVLILFELFQNDSFAIVIRLLVAALLASIIGIEREFKRHPAGLRTHILVGVGSCLMMILSMYGFESFRNTDLNIRFDPSRIPSYVISGIGFIGAGTILVHGRTVKGLTTAASIWIVAGIGLVVGAGMFFEAFLTTIIVVISLWLLARIEPLSEKKFRQQQLFVHVTGSDVSYNDFTKIFDTLHIQVEKVSVEKIKRFDETITTYQFYFRAFQAKKMNTLIHRLQQLTDVIKITSEEG